MIKATTLVLGCLTLAGCGSDVSAAPPETKADQLVIQINGLRGHEGNVVVAVYDNKQAFDQHLEPLAWVSVPAKSQTITLAEFPNQKVAIAAFHDTNRNGEYDVQGDFPLEGWGNSGDISIWTEPTFEAALTDARFVAVQMHYYQ